MANLPLGGNEPPDEDWCNFDRHVDDTTATGRYSPQGDSPYGWADIAGSVAGWCQSLDQPYPYRADNWQEDLGADGLQMVRGGSFIGNERYVRCAYREGLMLVYWDVSLGFRAAALVGH